MRIFVYNNIYMTQRQTLFMHNEKTIQTAAYIYLWYYETESILLLRYYFIKRLKKEILLLH